ncbi:MAG: SulP family inorganic anion transporter [Pirellulaceae bacterium]|nr:SulP family inorganic anion transporter [Pirellulaceae bacterium]
MPANSPRSNPRNSSRNGPRNNASESVRHPIGRVLSLVPAFHSLTTYSGSYFRRDLIAGLTVAAVAVPQAMAYASIFGMPVELGLYTAIVMTAVGALFASSKQLINGPTNAISIAMLSALAFVPAEERVSAAILMAALIGIIQTGITLLRLGDLSRFISHAVVVGFTVGASILLVLDQLKNVFGFKAQGGHHDHFLTRFYLTMTQGGPVHWPTLYVAIGTVIVALLVRRISKALGWRLPELLLAIVAAGLATWWLDLGSPRWGVKLVENIPRSLPTFQAPDWDWVLVRELAPSALAIALLGLLEAIAMAKSIALKTRQKLDINQQCLSEGLANLAGSFFRCFPGSGSLTRSYINYQAGAATEWSGIFAAGAVALTVLLFAPLAQYIPRAALSGVLMLTAIRMTDPEALRYHFKATRFDALIVTATALAAIVVSVEFCILVGVLLSFMFYVPKAARIEVSQLTVTKQGNVRERLENDPQCDRVRIENFEGELFFGASPAFEEALERIEEETLTPSAVGLSKASQPSSALSDQQSAVQAALPAAVVILRLRYVRNWDAVCLHVLHDFIERMQAAGHVVLLSGVRDEAYKSFKNVGIVAEIGEERVFREVPELWSSTFKAIQYAYAHLGEHRCAQCPRAAGPIQPADDWSFMI